MSTGFLTVRASAFEQAMPVPGAKAEIYDMSGNLLHTLYTDESGLTARVELTAPPAWTQFDPALIIRPYSRYTVEITAPGYNTVIVRGVQIYGDSSSVLPVDMTPVPPGQPGRTEEYEIGENALEMGAGQLQEQEYEPPALTVPFLHREVFIPTRITVHLGRPGSDASNVTVPFIDYIKNVASSEIFPDWPYHSLRANIHAQISIALNRVFTEWYRGKGYIFDITNSTQYDQYFVYGRNIYDSVSAIADEIFNTYVVRPPGIEPFYTEYCDGLRVTCPGMKQWGTVTLANQGMNYLQILRYYYGPSIYIASTNNIRAPFESFRGNLTLGSSGEDVAMIQMMLARIGQNYPQMPPVAVDGVYGSQTVAAVRTFQRIFGLAQTGTVDRRTWYQISNIFTAVARLAELGSEGFRPPVITPPAPPPLPTNPPYPGTPLRAGSRGNDVIIMQQFLNTIGTAFPSIPRLVVDGVFGPATQLAVMAFQRQFGLTPDGVIGPATWQSIVQIYNQVGGTPTPPPTAPQYPGTPLRNGSRGAAVVIVQEYLNRAAARNPSIPRLVTDGIFGPMTETAVREFQRIFGLTVDGIVGPVTWNRLVSLEL